MLGRVRFFGICQARILPCACIFRSLITWGSSSKDACHHPWHFPGSDYLCGKSILAEAKSRMVPETTLLRTRTNRHRDAAPE